MLNVWLYSHRTFSCSLSYLSDTITEYIMDKPLFTPLSHPWVWPPMNIYSPLLSWLSKTKIPIFFLFPKQTKTTWHACFTFPFILRTPLVYFWFLLVVLLSVYHACVIRTPFGPTCRYTSVLSGTRMTLAHSGWWMTTSSWNGGTCLADDPESMNLPRLHRPSLVS